jgi:hypothetical protein
MNKKILVISTISLIFIASAIAVYFNFFNKQEAPELAKENEEEVKDYLASDDFADLSNEDKKDYVTKLSESEIPFRRRQSADGEEPSEEEKERGKKIRENVRPVMREMIMERVNNYFEVPENEKEKYLDDMIDEMQERMKEWEKRREMKVFHDGAG